MALNNAAIPIYLLLILLGHNNVPTGPDKAVKHLPQLEVCNRSCRSSVDASFCGAAYQYTYIYIILRELAHENRM